MKLLPLTRHLRSDRLVPATHRKLAALIGAFGSAPTDRDAARVSHELAAIRDHSATSH